MAVYNYLSPQGVIVGDTAQVKTDAQQEWLNLPGINALPDPSSFEGRRLDAEITSRQSVARNNAAVANQINPNLSDGVFLDALVALCGGERGAAESSTAGCLLTGVPGATIPAGSIVEDVNGEQWQSATAAVLNASGEAGIVFQSINKGPILAAIGEINAIVSSILGWETVTNLSAATAGKDEQTTVELKNTRLELLGGNARAVAESIIASVRQVEGVAGLQFRENIKDTAAVIDNVSMAPKSTWLCVDGGLDDDIAVAYYTNRWGTDFNGAVTIPYVDPVSSQEVDVKIDRPSLISIICRVTASVAQTLTATQDIKQAVLNYAAGLVENERGFAVGENISPFEIAASINKQLTEVYVNNCEVGLKSGGVLAPATIELEIFQKGRIIEVDIEVVLV